MSSIYYVLALNVLNGMSVQASRVLLALYALELGAQPVTVGALAATFSIFPMLLAVVTGKLADRYGSRWLIVIGAAGSAIGLFLPFLIRDLHVIFVAAALGGMSNVIFGVSTQNLVGRLSTPENRSRNFSNYSMSNAMSTSIGPLIAGFSIEHSGHALTCLYLSLLSLTPIVLLIARRRPPSSGLRQRAAPAEGGVRLLLAGPGVRRALVTASIQNTGDSLYSFYMPVYTHSIGLLPSVIGMVLAMNAVAAFVVRLVLPHLIVKLKEERLLEYAFYVGAISLMLVPFFESALMLGLISFIFGLGMGCCGPVVTMLMYGNAPRGRSGEAIGLKVTVTHFTKVISPVIFGSIASAFGLPPIFWVDAVMLGLGGWLSHPKKKRKHGQF